MSWAIGRLALDGRVLLAPMAGVTDPPFRDLCAEHGAALACGEMLSADQSLWHSAKSRRRMAQPIAAQAMIAVQLAGADPQQLAAAAQHQVDAGADLIDLNLGCPAKKVCDRLCGSALLSDEDLVARLFDALVRAVNVPVTAKIRTGPDPTRRNATRIAQLAERSGIAAIAVHGRTRADRFQGSAEYDTIRAVKAQVSDTGDRERRCQHSATGARGAGGHRRRCGDDRPRGAGLTMDLPRCQCIPRYKKNSSATLARVDYCDHP